ncbi:MAG TPA: TMEM175 family protein [Polyangiaceae bacterium]|jgi:hypothetical protein|nr:TMEM175 family protein [Polyangiaceae bacterium]
MSKHRLDALSDGIFAVAMALLVIELKIPTGAPSVALVSDGVRAVVLPATPDLRPHIGRLVSLCREPSGRLCVVGDDLDRGR